MKEATEGLGMPEPRLLLLVGNPHQAVLDLALEHLEKAGLVESPDGQMGGGAINPRAGYSLWRATSKGKRAVIDAGLLE